MESAIRCAVKETALHLVGDCRGCGCAGCIGCSIVRGGGVGVSRDSNRPGGICVNGSSGRRVVIPPLGDGGVGGTGFASGNVSGTPSVTFTDQRGEKWPSSWCDVSPRPKISDDDGGVCQTLTTPTSAPSEEVVTDLESIQSHNIEEPALTGMVADAGHRCDDTEGRRVGGLRRDGVADTGTHGVMLMTPRVASEGLRGVALPGAVPGASLPSRPIRQAPPTSAVDGRCITPELLSGSLRPSKHEVGALSPHVPSLMRAASLSMRTQDVGSETPRVVSPPRRQLQSTLSAWEGPQTSLRARGISCSRKGLRVNSNHPLRSTATYHFRRGRSSLASESSESGIRPSIGIVDFTCGGIFDSAVLLALLVNAFTIGLQVDSALQNSEMSATTKWYYRLIEQGFLVIFATEVLIRFRVLGRQFFSGPFWRWNVFDCIVVVAHLGDVLADVFLAEVLSGRLSSFTSVLQVVRILRLFRLVRFVRELNKLILLIKGSMVSFIWTVALLLLMTYICGVFFAKVVADHRRGGGIMSADLHLFFGSLRSSLLSLFAATSGGVDWSDVLRPLMLDISPWLAIVFCLYIAFAVLVMMNLVTGVFVDGAKLLSKAERQQELLLKLESVFHESDQNSYGYITLRDFQACVHKPGMQNFLESLCMEPCEAAAVFACFDRDGNSNLTLEEFVSESFRLCGQARACDVAMLRMQLNDVLSTVEARFRSLEEQIDQCFGLTHKQVPPNSARSEGNYEAV
eukprot:TRINITY_DN31299_c0_g1_i2.p1 TRINITY_DN31299_c0_g1~~TRINITY_DN31299_c0_g1_i2.p1  ORF type:complete len:846 (+),score=151.53 TRINITY_DN31299_c0_g1_i2:315-2540(+)